ncbi:hypothetical protein EYF80_030506 [Liparis tanakae]|uniref:Uncharacterized protein n=1 Tax=Liparis tanakae TaxID=230148 RepID=A0A4Z2H0F6_9TELE|nr:hypothetical protein EYF80_030506 [Liparis tanakae]
MTKKLLIFSSSQSVSLEIVVEGEVVMDNFQDLPKDICLLSVLHTELPQVFEAHVPVHPADSKKMSDRRTELEKMIRKMEPQEDK